MQNILKKKWGFVLSLVTLIILIVASSVFASTTIRRSNKIVTTTTYETTQWKQSGEKYIPNTGEEHDSTIYAGEIKKDGVTVLQYLYSEDVTHSSVIFDNLRKALPTDFSDLIPTITSVQTESGMKELSVATLNNVDLATISEDWTDASSIASQIYHGTNTNIVNSNMYDINDEFQAEVDAQASEREEGLDHPIETNKRIVSHLGTNTVDSVTFTVENSQLVEYHDVDLTYLSEATTVKYTSVDVITPTEDLIWTVKDGPITIETPEDELRYGFWLDYADEALGIIKMDYDEENDCVTIYSPENKFLFSYVESETDEALIITVADDVTSGDNIIYTITDEDRANDEEFIGTELAKYKTVQLLFDAGEEEDGRYIVTFNSNGGSAVESQKVASGEKIAKPADPTNGELEFIGWFVNPTLENLYYYERNESGEIDLSTLRYNTFDFATPITENVELTALWLAKVTVNTEGAGSGQICLVEKEFGGAIEFDDEYPYTTSTAPSVLGIKDQFMIGAKEKEGSEFVRWTKNGKEFSKEKIITLAVTENSDFVAEFQTKSASNSSRGGSSSSSYKITTKTENENVEITPKNPSVKKNGSQEFTFTPKAGFEIVDVLVDGKSVGAVEKYTLEKVTAKHTIEVKTKKTTPWSKADEWAVEELTEAAEKGLIPETLYKKDFTNNISRADFCAVAVKMYEALTGTKVEAVKENPFTDIDDEYVLKAYGVGITKGISDTQFGNGPITREQMATMIDRALNMNMSIDLDAVVKFLDDNEMHDWGRPSIYALFDKGIIKGVGENRFDPLGNTKIEEAIAIVLRCFKLLKK